MKLKVSIIIAVAATLIFSVIGYAAANIEKIEAYLANDMGFTVDGEAWQPKDVDGSILAPIIYKGRSYVPVRALLEEQNVKVDFDGDTRTIILDYPTKTVDKSTPKLAESIASKSTEDGSVTIEFSATKENDFYGVPIVNETTFELSDDAEIFISGQQISLEEWINADGPMKDFEKIIVKYEPQKNSVTSVHIEEQDGEAIESKVDIEIEISGPPFKIKITFKF